MIYKSKGEKWLYVEISKRANWNEYRQRLWIKKMGFKLRLRKLYNLQSILKFKLIS